MSDYGQLSYWLDNCGEELTPRPRLDGSIAVDVGILGAGFSGLWNAWYLLQRDPSLKILIIDQAIAGFGASGRNGGIVGSSFPYSLGRLDRDFGTDVARATYAAMHDSLDEIFRVVESEDIGAHLHRGGGLRFARETHQLAAVDRELETYARLGLERYVESVDRDDIQHRANVAGAIRGILYCDNAVVQPARLARGLARALERRGVTIYEETRVLAWEGGDAPTLLTDRGDVRCRALVVAGEAYLSQIPQTRRAVAPFHSLMTITEPLSDRQWEEIGWQNRESIGTTQYSVNYHQRTADGRIAFGGLGAPYYFRSKIQDRWNPGHVIFGRLRSLATEWFPVLQGIRFTHAWGGPFGMPRDRMPTMSYDPDSGIAIACGYTGQGVTTANLAGRVLADLITGTGSDLTRLPPANHRIRNWEPEPLRWAGIRFVQSGYDEIERRSRLTGQPPSGHSIAERIGWR